MSDVITNFCDIGGDLGNQLITKEYFVRNYPFMLHTAKQSGVYVWGSNSDGQLGTGENGTGTEKSSPVQTVAYGHDWRQISSGNNFVTSLKKDDSVARVWSWGDNLYGKLGVGNTTDRNTPTTLCGSNLNIFRRVAEGPGDQDHSLALRTNETLVAWGRNDYGELGDNTTTDRTAAVSIVGGVATWKYALVGTHHSGALVGSTLSTAGRLYMWGDNAYGQLGIGNYTSKSTPVATTGNYTWKTASGGGCHTLAIKDDGTLWAWGLNTSGQLGLGTTTGCCNTPTLVSASTDWLEVAGGSLFSVAIKKDGSLWLWGVNTYGQLGDNSITTRSTPTELIYPSCSKDWAKVSAGKNHVAAIKKDGTLWAWGLNSSGQLGQSDTTDRSTPTQIGTGSLAATWFRVSAGSAHTAAIKDAGIDF